MIATRLFLCAVFFFCGSGIACMAQNILTGKVTDKETQRPVEGASVLLFAASQKAALAYAVTNASGDYSITLKDRYGDSIRIEVSTLGYAKQIFALKNESRRLVVALAPEAMNLKEVVVRANKLWLQNDTLNYDVSQFKTLQDRAIGDVLKKMPGIQIAQSGAISYKGTPINKFYIEGSDLLDGKYNLATKNIPADAVSKVQVLENHQPVKALEKTDFSEQAAINLVLKDGAKSRWLGSVDAGLGAYPFLWDARLTGMRVGRGTQTLNIYKTNNIGQELSNEVNKFTFSGISTPNENNAIEADWLSVVTPAPPAIAENRYLFNRSQLVSSNSLWKLPHNYELRANVSYLNDQRNFDSESRTVYYVETDSLLSLSEQQQSKRKQHQLNAGLTLTANKPAFYLQNNLTVQGRWNETTANTFDGANTVSQQLSTPNHNLINDFQWVKKIKTHTFQVTSYTGYSLLPQELQVSPAMYEFTGVPDNNQPLCQNLRMTSFLTNNYATFKTTKGNWRLEFKAGFQAQVQHLNSELYSLTGATPQAVADSLSNHIGLTKYRYSAQPLFGYQGQRFKFSVAVPFNYSVIDNTHYLRLNPSCFVSYNLNAYWTIFARAGYNNNFGDIRTLTTGYILYNYRSIARYTNDLSELSQQSYSLNLSYRNSVNAFFASLAAGYNIGSSNILYDRCFNGLLSERTAVLQPNNKDTWFATIELSKTIEDWNTTLWLNLDYNRSSAEQLSQHEWTQFANESAGIQPKILLKPARWTNIEYRATFSRSQQQLLAPQASKSAPILEMSHFLTWNLNILKNWQGYMHGEYFGNKIENASYPAAFFADAGVRYLLKKWEFSVDFKNIFNTKYYEYTVLGNLSESFSAFELRPVSILLKASISF